MTDTEEILSIKESEKWGFFLRFWMIKLILISLNVLSHKGKLYGHLGRCHNLLIWISVPTGAVPTNF